MTSPTMATTRATPRPTAVRTILGSGSLLSSVAAMLALGALAGCQQRVNPQPPVALAPEPLATDEAMLKRTWDRQTAVYTNPGFIAGPTGILWEIKDPESRPGYQVLLLDAGGFLGNVGSMPYTLIKTPVWAKVEYRGLSVPPTFTAMPPLPGEEQEYGGVPAEPAAPAPAGEPSIQPGEPVVPPHEPEPTAAPEPKHPEPSNEPSEPMEPVNPPSAPKANGSSR